MTERGVGWGDEIQRENSVKNCKGESMRRCEGEKVKRGVKRNTDGDMQGSREKRS